MKFLLFNHIQNARQSLKTNRVRSILTMTGVMIGVASVTAIFALSGGASKIVSDQIQLLKGNIAIVRPGEPDNGGISSLTDSQSSQQFSTSTLTEQDVEIIRDINHVQSVAPFMKLTGTIKGEMTAPSTSRVVATTPELGDISNLEVREGQFIDNEMSENTAVIGTQLSINLFNSESSLGRTFTFRDQDFTVVGVLKTIDNPINYNSIDFDNAAIINFSIGKTINKDISQIQQINIQADDAKYIQSVVDEVNKKILSNHNGENDFAVLTGDKISQPTSQLFYTAAGLTTAIAAISLLVGGIGIMNIMLVTVAERTREIGIRKALGANNMDITMQFLIESIAISLCGGILGYLLGYVAAFGISTMLTFDPIFSTDILLIALSISLIMGTLFGIYPAFRAASKDPVESLHNYH